WRGRRLRVTASEALSYGEVNYTYLVPDPNSALTPDAPRQLMPADGTLLEGSSQTALVVEGAIARKLSFRFMPSYTIGGGLDAPSRAIVPLQTTPRLDAALTYAASAHDQIGPQVGLWASRSTSRPCDPSTGGPPARLEGAASCATRIEGAAGQLAYRRVL